MFQIFEWIAAITITLGGSSVIIIALSKWFGGVMANKLLEKDKAKYLQELEEIKANFQLQLESQKLEIEKSKSLFLRYSEHQFNLYNDLWKQLCELKFVVEELWKQVELVKVKKLSIEIKKTIRTTEKSALLIEPDDYNQLMTILKRISKYQIGKTNLIKLRNKSIHEMQDLGIDNYSIRQVITENGETKDNLLNLMEILKVNFKKQIQETKK